MPYVSPEGRYYDGSGGGGSEHYAALDELVRQLEEYGITNLKEYMDDTYLSEDDMITKDDIDIITGNITSQEDLIEQFQNGDNVILDADVVLDEVIELDHDFDIDLNGKTLTGTTSGSAYQFVANGAKLTIKNGNIVNNGRIANAVNGGEVIIESGTFNSGDVAFTAIGSGSKITMTDGAVNAVEGGLMAVDGAEVIIEHGEINVSDNFCIGTNGSSGRGGNTIIMNGGTLTGRITSAGYEAIGVYIANNDTFIMNDGEIVAIDGAGLVMRGGHVTINEGIIAATGEAGTTGWVGDNKTKMSKSAIIYHESANYPGKAGMSLVINGGTIIGVDHSVEVLSNEDTPNVTITNGEFDPAYPEN
jgi:hypothetical protein